MPLNMSADEKSLFFRSARLHELRLHRLHTRADGVVFLEVKHEPEDRSVPIRAVGRVRLRADVVELHHYFPGVTPHITDERHFETCVRDTLEAYRHHGRPLSAAFDLFVDQPERGSSSLPVLIRTLIEKVRVSAAV